jgi:hypothetical protein
MVITNRPSPKVSKTSAHNLAYLQKMMATAIMQPLQEDDCIQEFFPDGLRMKDVAGEIIKPNRFLSSLERLELYNRQYWFRLLDSFYDDFPGLMAVLGDKKCEALATAYLSRCPSNSFSLRDLGSRLERFVLDEPDWVKPDYQLALDMIRFEWAEIVAFDGPAKPAIKPEDLANVDPMQLKLELQPYITLLELNYAVDDFLLRLNKKSDKTVESNAVIEFKREKKRRTHPKEEHNYVAVHRLDDVVYYKRLAVDQYTILNLLAQGKTLAQACAGTHHPQLETEMSTIRATLSNDFSTWMELGWFCGVS